VFVDRQLFPDDRGCSDGHNHKSSKVTFQIPPRQSLSTVQVRAVFHYVYITFLCFHVLRVIFAAS